MKMMPTEQYGLGLGILDAMEDLNQGLQQDKGIQLASVSVSILDWSLLGRWAEQGVRNSWRSVKFQTCVLASKDWQHPTQ